MSKRIHLVKKPACLVLIAWSIIVSPSRLVGQQSTGARPQLALQTGHWGNVLSAAFSPDSKTIATVGDDWNVKLWDVATKRVVRTLPGHTTSLNSVAFSSNGKLLATGGFDTQIKIWNPQTGAEHFTLNDSEIVTALAFSPNNKLLATGLGSGGAFPGKISIWDLALRKVRFSFDENSQGISQVEFSPDSRLLVSGGKDGKLKVWHCTSGALQRQWDAHASGVSSIAVSADGKSIVSSGEADGAIKFWKLATGELERTLDGEANEKNCVSLSPACNCMVVGNSEVKLYDLSTGTLQQSLSRKTINSNKVLISPNGELVLNIGVEENGNDASADVYVWKTQSGEFHGKLVGHKQGIVATVRNPFLNTLITADSDKRINVWDLQTGVMKATLALADEIKALALSEDGKTLAAGGGDFGKPGIVYLFDLQTWQLRTKLTGHLLPVRSIAFSKDGSTLLSGSSDGTLKLWQVATGKEQQTIKNGTLPVLVTAFANDDNAILAGTLDGTIRAWERKTGSLSKELKDQTTGVFVFALSADGKTLLTAGPNTAGFSSWDTSTWKLNRSIRNPLLSPTAIQFAGNSTVIVSNANGHVQLWDLVTGKMVRHITEHDLAGSSLVLIKNRYLASAGHDGVIQLLDLDSKKLMATLFSPRPDEIDGAATQKVTPAPNGEYLTIVPAGYFDGSPIGELATNLRVSNRLFPAKQLHLHYYRPKLVRKALRE